MDQAVHVHVHVHVHVPVTKLFVIFPSGKGHEEEQIQLADGGKTRRPCGGGPGRGFGIFDCRDHLLDSMAVIAGFESRNILTDSFSREIIPSFDGSRLNDKGTIII